MPLASQFTVAETGLNPAKITATATSNNQTILPNGGLVVTPVQPTNGSRTLTITPANNQTGVATSRSTPVTAPIDEQKRPGVGNHHGASALAITSIGPPTIPSSALAGMNR